MDSLRQYTPTNICSDRVLVDFRTHTDAINSLKQLGVTVYKTTPIKTLYNEVMGHSDMQIHFIGKKAICTPEAYDYYVELNLSDIELICGSKSLKSTYPDDIAYNVCSVGDYVICRPLCAAIEIISEYQRMKKEILNTKQGYTKCNICVVNSQSVITSDDGIYKLLKNKKMNVLKIRPGYIELYNMEGFIGGATGLINNILYFNGDIKTHPDANNMIDFCKNVGVDTFSLNKGNLIDIGSILQF